MAPADSTDFHQLMTQPTYQVFINSFPSPLCLNVSSTTQDTSHRTARRSELEPSTWLAKKLQFSPGLGQQKQQKKKRESKQHHPLEGCVALVSLLARHSCLGRSRTENFVGDQGPDALAWLGLQELEVSAGGQCGWVPAASEQIHLLDLDQTSRCQHAVGTLQPKPWLVTTLRPELEAALPVSEASLGDRQHHILLQRSAGGSATLQGLTVAATAQVTNPSNIS